MKHRVVATSDYSLRGLKGTPFTRPIICDFGVTCKLLQIMQLFAQFRAKITNINLNTELKKWQMLSTFIAVELLQS